ncbi:universal stress protein [Desulfocicer niacini]
MRIMVYCKNVKTISKALDIAVEHAKAFNASVDLVSVFEDRPDLPGEVIEKNTEELKKIATEMFTNEGIRCISQVLVSTLSIGEAVVQYAEKNGITEIIMALRKRSKVGKLFFGSNTQYIILEAPCRVITTKE